MKYLQDAEQDLLRVLLPEWARSRAYIAGGYAIAPHTAKDIDVWVFVSEKQAEELASWASEHWGPSDEVTVYNIPVDVPDCAGLSGRNLEICEMYRDGIPNWTELGIARLMHVEMRGMRKVQVFTVSGSKDVRVPSIYSLLDAFDISTHRWAITLDGHKFMEADVLATLPSQLPRVTRFSTPGYTAQRLVKVLDRYGWKRFGHPDIGPLTEAAKKLGNKHLAQVTAAFGYAPLTHDDLVAVDDLPF